MLFSLLLVFNFLALAFSHFAFFPCRLAVPYFVTTTMRHLPTHAPSCCTELLAEAYSRLRNVDLPVAAPSRAEPGLARDELLLHAVFRVLWKSYHVAPFTRKG